MRAWHALWHEMDPAFYLVLVVAACFLVGGLSIGLHMSPVIRIP
jgi:hypothetical protein